MIKTASRILAATFWLMLTGGHALAAPETAVAGNGGVQDAREIFDKARGRIYQIRTLTVDGDAESSSGSGFLVGENGLIATNWHVISEKILDSARYRLEVERTDKRRVPVTVVAIDSMNDLALLQAAGETGVPFPIHNAPLEKGDKGFSLGNPQGVGFTVVEGLYNGVEERTLEGNYHFTGALNPGMSGGPALTQEGAVFGINVSKRSDSTLISFLVPAQRLAALMARQRSANPTPDALLQEARSGMIQGQERVTKAILRTPTERRAIGAFMLPTDLGSASRCWGSSSQKQQDEYTTESLICVTGVRVIAGNMSVGTISTQYQVIRNRGLNPFRFAARLSEENSKDKDAGGDPETVHRFECRTSYVKLKGGTAQATLCTRPYKKIEGLQNAILNVVTVDSSQEGLVGRLTMSGFTEENVKRLGRWYLETIEWKR